MLSITSQSRFFLARKPVDFRKAFDGLSIVIREDLGLDPRTGDHFIFFNRLRNRVKIMVWDASPKKKRAGSQAYRKDTEEGATCLFCPELPWSSGPEEGSVILIGGDPGLDGVY